MSEWIVLYLLAGCAVVGLGWRKDLLPITGLADAAATLIAVAGIVVMWPLAAILRVTAPASAMSTGTAKTPKAVEGRSPASAVAKPDAQGPSA